MGRWEGPGSAGHTPASARRPGAAQPPIAGDVKSPAEGRGHRVAGPGAGGGQADAADWIPPPRPRQPTAPIARTSERAGLLPGRRRSEEPGRASSFGAGALLPLHRRLAPRWVRMLGLTASDAPPTVAVTIFSAGVAAGVADVITFPLDTAIVRLQVGSAMGKGRCLGQRRDPYWVRPFDSGFGFTILSHFR